MDFNIEYTNTEKEKINKMTSMIDINNYYIVSNYGLPAQNKIAETSKEILNKSNMYNNEDIIKPLNLLLDKFTPEEDKGGILSFFYKKPKENTEYNIELFDTEINNIIDVLERKQVEIKEDNYTLEDLKRYCINIYKELSMFLESGNNKLKKLNSSENNIEVFKKRLEGLEVSKIVCTQTYAQIELIQSSNKEMELKIQETIFNVIPLWRSQVIIANTINNNKELRDTQNKIKDGLISLANENAEKIKRGIK